MLHLFNSHPHKADDDDVDEELKAVEFSTHILTRRMTCFPVFVLVHQSFFNSHPHKEDDIIAFITDRIPDFSTHILTRRMTR